MAAAALPPGLEFLFEVSIISYEANEPLYEMYEIEPYCVTLSKRCPHQFMTKESCHRLVLGNVSQHATPLDQAQRAPCSEGQQQRNGRSRVQFQGGNCDDHVRPGPEALLGPVVEQAL